MTAGTFASRRRYTGTTVNDNRRDVLLCEAIVLLMKPTSA
jgi:hypothetical protein